MQSSSRFGRYLTDCPGRMLKSTGTTLRNTVALRHSDHLERCTWRCSAFLARFERERDVGRVTVTRSGERVVVACL